MIMGTNRRAKNHGKRDGIIAFNVRYTLPLV